MTGENYCPNCGTQVSATARFCPSCGAAIGYASANIPLVPPTQVLRQPEEPAPPAPAAYMPEPAGYAYPTSEPPKKRPVWVYGVGAGGGCLLILLIGLCLGMLVFRDKDGDKSEATETTLPAVEETVQAVIAVDTPAAPAAPSNALSGKQEKTDERLFDDFSSKALGWTEGPMAEGWTGYQDGGFVIRVTAKDRGIISPVPLASLPNHISFSARVTSGEEGGIYGIRCLAKDKQNFFEVWIDKDTNSYRLMQFSGDNATALVDWTETMDLSFGDDPDTVVIECLPGMISLELNDSLQFEQPIEGVNGLMYLMVKTYEEMSTPVEVLFDDVEAWKQMQ